jgi:hypothetical protein
LGLTALRKGESDFVNALGGSQDDPIAPDLPVNGFWTWNLTIDGGYAA